MEYTCVYGDCLNTSNVKTLENGAEIKFYRFPQPCSLLLSSGPTWSELEGKMHLKNCEHCTLASIWLISCKRSDGKLDTVRNITPDFYVCSTHFEEAPDEIDYKLHFPSGRPVDGIVIDCDNSSEKSPATLCGTTPIEPETITSPGELKEELEREIPVDTDTKDPPDDVKVLPWCQSHLVGPTEEGEEEVKSEIEIPDGYNPAAGDALSIEITPKLDPELVVPDADSEPEPDPERIKLRSYVCDECGLAFGYSSHLTDHKRTHTGEKPYRCELCDKGFTKQSNLRVHRRTHTGEKPYVCNDCGKRFAQPGHLLTHERAHRGDKPYECTECGKSFARSGHLASHVKIHTGEKPFPCDQCGLGCRDASTLLRHQMTHTGEKPFNCNMCDRSFTHVTYLNVHKRTHTGEKPFQCMVCSQRFADGSVFARHLKIHSGDRPHACSLCHKKFITKSNLQRHVKIHSSVYNQCD